MPIDHNLRVGPLNRLPSVEPSATPLTSIDQMSELDERTDRQQEVARSGVAATLDESRNVPVSTTINGMTPLLTRIDELQPAGRRRIRRWAEDRIAAAIQNHPKIGAAVVGGAVTVSALFGGGGGSKPSDVPRPPSVRRTMEDAAQRQIDEKLAAAAETAEKVSQELLGRPADDAHKQLAKDLAAQGKEAEVDAALRAAIANTADYQLAHLDEVITKVLANNGLPKPRGNSPLYQTAQDLVRAGHRGADLEARILDAAAKLNPAEVAKRFLERHVGDLKYDTSDDLQMQTWVPNNVNCANFVSAVLESVGLLDPGGMHAAVRTLEQNLLARGWTKVPIEQARAGDVVVYGGHEHVEIALGPDGAVGARNLNRDGTQRIALRAGLDGPGSGVEVYRAPSVIP